MVTAMTAVILSSCHDIGIVCFRWETIGLLRLALAVELRVLLRTIDARLVYICLR